MDEQWSRHSSSITVFCPDRFGKPTQFAPAAAEIVDPFPVVPADRTATQGSMVDSGARRAGGSVHRHVDLVDRAELIGEMTSDQFGQTRRECRPDHQCRRCCGGDCTECQQLPGVVERITYGDDMNAAFEQSRRHRGMVTGVRKDGDVAGHRVGDFEATRIGVNHTPGVQQPVNSSTDDATPDEMNSRLVARHGCSGGISSGRHPPCCGGIPPVPRMRKPAAATPAIANAARIRRNSFILGSHVDRSRGRPTRSRSTQSRATGAGSKLHGNRTPRTPTVGNPAVDTPADSAIGSMMRSISRRGSQWRVHRSSPNIIGNPAQRQ